MRPSGGAPGQEPPSSQHYEPGVVIGDKYRLVRRLDEGGMGTVWVAHNLDLDAHVALKLLRPEASAENTAERLLNEARVLARLGHPAIVRVNDFGRTDTGDPFIVMELLEGECLADLAYRQGRFSAASAVQLLLPIAEALAVAHERGIVHRDLKPDNVFLARLGVNRVQPKVLDFGIARTAVDGSMRLTRDGTVLGSPAYMSPEQARGERDLDCRTDVWSFCIVLYELLVGSTPFEGENYNAVLRAIIDTEPEPITDLAAGDAALWQVLARGLHKHREQRWPSMRALGAELAAWLMSHGVAEDITRASLPSTWFDASCPESDPFSVPPVALPRSSSVPPIPRRTPAETVDSARLALPVVTTGTSSLRLSTGGHGAVAFTAGSTRSTPRRRRAALGMATFVIGVGAVLAWRAVGGAATAPSAHPVGANAPSASALRASPPQAPSVALPVPERTVMTDAGVKQEAGADDRPSASSVPSHPPRRPAVKRRAPGSHLRPRPAHKSGSIGDLKVPY